MPPVPDSSSTPSTEAISHVEAGLAALKQKHWDRAIALLEASDLPRHHPLAAKAQMGLVVAYTRSGKIKPAVELCQTLLQHPNPQVQQWASQTLTNLERRLASIPSPISPSEAEDEATDKTVDLTGFVPFDGSAAASQPVAQAAPGHTPITGPAQIPAQPVSERDPSEQSNAAMNPEVEAGRLAPPVLPFQPIWRQAGRAQFPLKSLGRVDVTKLWGLQIITAIALFWVIQQVIYLTLATPSFILRSIPLLQFQTTMFNPPFWSVLLTLVALWVGSRWILDGLLRLEYGLQPLSLSKLGAYSPETVQSLNRYCRQRKIPLPDLGVLPTQAPLALSYGVLPRLTRVVVSQGLLEQLADDEIATVFAAEVGHIAHRDVALMSLIMVVIQLPYTLYWAIAKWGNQQENNLLKVLAAWVASAAYGLYCLWRFIGLWLSRYRLYYSDRVASELTGNPNGFTRALLKIAIGTAQEVQRQGQTSYLLEGFDLLSPLGHRMATPLGSFFPHVPLETVLQWEWTHPLRHWLAMNNSHPPTGDRLHLLSLYAQHWKLPAELNLLNDQPAGRQRRSRFNFKQWGWLLLQGAPFFGLVAGLAIAVALSLLGATSWRLGNDRLLWLVGESSILRGLALVGFSIGTFIRINPFFPEVPSASGQQEYGERCLASLMQQPMQIPVQGQAVRLQGTLLGRPGIANKLSQDLLLQTETGLIWLHCISPLGPLGNLLTRSVHFTDLIQQPLLAIGWFRRGATPWVDIELLRTPGGRTDRSNHPLWATLMALIAACIGIGAIAFGKVS